MLPANLKAEQFHAYPAQARTLVVAYLPTIQKLPLSFVPSLLREAIDYDFKFPAERKAVDRELAQLKSLKPAELEDWFQQFSKITLSERLETFDWINQPAQFLEQQSAYLWSTHQLDAFRQAAMDYGDRMQAVAPPEPLPARRLGVAIIGQGVARYDKPLFRKLRQHGTYFARVNPQNGLEKILSVAAARSSKHPAPYAHWYVDGGEPVAYDAALTLVSYQVLEPVRAALLKQMQKEIARPGMGPEELRTHMAQMLPADLGMSQDGDAVLDRFQIKLLTEGSGTQIFSTTFAQWTARETLRRAQPLTLVVRFAPRQRQRSMNDMLSGSHGDPEPDPIGSLVDADMGAYYHWLNQQRLAGAEQSAFLAWFEGHNQAVVVAPSFPRGTESNSAMDLGALLSLATS